MLAAWKPWSANSRMAAARTGLGLFTLASAAAALAPSTGSLIAARAVQGAGAAVLLPLTLTLLSEAFPADRRGIALGIWSGISGLGVALGPVIGGAVVDGISWHWIFWLNVPVGGVLAPLALARLSESHGPARRLDLPGLGLASTGLLGIVYGLVRADALGWTSATVLATLIGGAILVAAFVAWELRTPAPMLPMRFFRSRAFAATNGVSLAMYFGIFGAIFLLAQFFQTAQGYSPLEAGLRTLPWTAMPILVAPIAGLLSDRIGSRPLMAAGLTLQAAALVWFASILDPALPYGRLVVPFMLAGAGMALVFAPAANSVLGAVRPSEAGRPRARRTPSASSAASSASRWSPRCSPAPAPTPRPTRLPGAGAIYARDVSAARPGSIIISHDGGGPRGQTLAALPRVIATLRRRGYKLVTVTDLLGLGLHQRD